MVTMQIPYDLEFVENRPLVAAKVVALQKQPTVWLGAGRAEQDQDVLDAVLLWMHRLVRRMEASRTGR
jgi:hypothetical protein